MNHPDTIAAKAYEDITNEVIEMLAALDDYRKDKPRDDRKLFKVHSIEGRIRRMIKAEDNRQNPPQLKTKAA